MPYPTLHFEDYTIAWIAPLEIEALAAQHMLDHRHRGNFPIGRGSDYVYSAGDINGHNIIIATIPPGHEYGVGAAGALASQVKNNCPNLWFGLLVGVAAGLPNLSLTPPRDIRLGDVLVASGDSTSTGLLRYGLGKETAQGFELLHQGRTANLEKVVMSAIGRIRTDALMNREESFLAHYHDMKKKYPHSSGAFEDPGLDKDKLHETIVRGDDGSAAEIVQRPHRDERTRVWYGIIGSGDKLMKYAKTRDKLRDEFNLIGLEMEAAGLIDTIPVGVIRGVCDYGDEQKNKEWQPYAAAMAAAYAKELLSIIQPKSVVPKTTQNDFYVPFDLKGMPYTRHFVDRDKEMKQIEDSLTPGDIVAGQRVHILHGLGGIGKTQLAIAYARKHKELYDATLWLDGSSKDNFWQSLADFGRRAKVVSLESTIGMNRHADSVGVEAQAVLSWLALPGNRRWLMIIDNADREHSQSDPQSFDISSVLHPIDQGCVLITSRLHTISGFKSYPDIKKLGLEQALELLTTWSGLPRTTNGRPTKGMNELVERLGYLPLALVQAGTYMVKMGISCHKYLELYENEWSKLVQKLPQLKDYRNGSIHTTWTISYEQMKTESTAAANLLQLWANLDRQEIWYELFRRGSRGCPECLWLQEVAQDESSFMSVIEPLLAYSLVESHRDTGSYSVHPVVHDWCSETISNDRVDLVMLAFVIVGYAVPDETEPNYSYLERRLIPHADRCIQRLYELGITDVTKYSESNEAFYNLGKLYADQGKLAEAEEMFQRALSGYEKLYSPEHLFVLRTVNGLGILYRAQGSPDKMSQAEKMFQRALSGYEEILGPEHPSTLTVVNNLGAIFAAQGNLAEAEKLYYRALNGYEKASEPETSILNTIGNLGNLCRNQGKLAEAEEMYQRALKGEEKVWGREHPSTLGTVHSLGKLYAGQGKLAEAEEMYQRALGGRENLLGPEHPSTLDVVYNLGILYTDQGKLAEAEEMYQRALGGRENLLGPEHPSTLDVVYNLGVLYTDQNKLVEAEKMYLRALNGKEKVLGREHPSTLDTVHNLGLLYVDQNKLAEAEKMYQRAIDGNEKVRGLDQPSTLRTVFCLGNLYADQDRVSEAKEKYHRAIIGYEKVLGSEYLSTFKATNDIGNTCTDQDDKRDVVKMYRWTLDRYRELGCLE